jgi:hypothetical protein
MGQEATRGTKVKYRNLKYVKFRKHEHSIFENENRSDMATAKMKGQQQGARKTETKRGGGGTVGGTSAFNADPLAERALIVGSFTYQLLFDF